ncbi:6-hydroxymethylpterin diphosphokinase MptE-like protein [Shewanella sp. NIFS-20-20]|uniref:motility associated factor glycosyltransferase family protein n=1 Tax=Shewanella sp. NIFS-20-20 TaxID=2853806 RepID=UPI001C4841AF|nr:6-hydroxymethylpterin diphosphokinase MptE-like protein [Shewanella sp. NIFS-20-20]MBV7316397.1 DUF115 domain-containing protein [Shewanella sp. NIFS-20-20]
MSLANPVLQHFSINAFDEVYLSAVNRNQFEHQSAASIFTEQYQPLLKKDMLFVILGTDSGLLANYILEQGLAEGSRYIFVEHPQILDVLSIDIDASVADKLLIITPEQLAEQLAQIEYDVYLAKKQFQLMQSQACSTAYFSDYQDLKTHCQQVIEHAFFWHAQNHKQKSFIEKQFLNMADNGFPAARLRQRFVGKTAIVIGGGPSLDESLDWIAEHQHQLVVMVVSRAAKQVQAAGIHIDFVLTVDPQPISFLISKPIFDLPATSILVHADHGVESLVGQWPYSHFYTGSQLPWQPQDNVPTVATTVTNSAIRLAVEMGCQQILLTGVDLCHSAMGVSHASGSVHGTIGPKLDFIGEWVTTYEGKLAETTLQLFEAMQSLAEQAANLNGAQLINLAASAAKIDGIRYVPKEDIVLPGIDDKQSRLAEIITEHPNLLAKDALLALKQQLTQAQQDFAAISKHAKRAIAIGDQFTPTSQQQLNEIEKLINDKYSLFMAFIKFYGYSHFSQFLTTSQQDSWQESDIVARQGIYYHAIKTTCDELLHLCQQSYDKVLTRLAEHNPKVDLVWLSQQWIQQQQPRRYVLWLASQPSRQQQLTPAEQQAIAMLEAATKAQFAQQVQRDHQGKLIVRSLNQTPQKIHHLYTSGNAEGLYLVYRALDWYQDKDERAFTLQARCLAYYHEINQDYAQAFEVLRQLAPQYREEIEIKQLVMMALKSHQILAAEEYLSQLLSLSHLYLPLLAHIQKLAGKHQQALNTYLDYLDKYPEDVITYIKLGQMLAELGQVQGALDVFLHAANLDPDNPLIQKCLAQLQQAQSQLSNG